MAAAGSGTGGPLLIQAREEFSLAQKEAGRWTMFSSTEKWEKAADHYRKAGNFFKAAMKWEEATTAYKEAAALFGKLREPSEELQMLREAATSLTHKDAKEAARMLEDILVPRLVDAGKLDEVGRMHLQIAESLDGEDVDAAMEHYRNAMNMFTSGGAASEALKCKLKLGQELGKQEMYDEAVDMFVQAAEGRLAKELTRLSARDHFLDAGICVLAKGDSVHARECLDRWCGMDYTFEDSREGRLFAKLIEVVEESKPEDFADAVYAFDSIKKLNPWRTKLLLRVKDAMAGGDEGDVADDLT